MMSSTNSFKATSSQASIPNEVVRGSFNRHHCLRAIGSDTALMQLNSIAQKLKFKALQNKARQFMDDIAAARGLSRLQLEDRIVPDLDAMVAAFGFPAVVEFKSQTYVARELHKSTTGSALSSRSAMKIRGMSGKWKAM